MGRNQWVIITWVIVCATIGMTAGNFSYQGLYKPLFENVAPDWKQSLDRSWFQWCMSFWIWICLRFALKIIKT